MTANSNTSRIMFFDAEAYPLELVTAPRVRKNCTSKCILVALKVPNEPLIEFRRAPTSSVGHNGEWRESQYHTNNRMVDPSTKPNFIYVAGSANCCTMGFWEDQWYAVYGIITKHKDKPVSHVFGGFGMRVVDFKIMILHNILGCLNQDDPWTQSEMKGIEAICASVFAG